MSKVFEKDAAQDAGVAAFVATTSGAAINGSGTGTGKTIMGIRALHERGGERFLIVAPPNTFGGWASTLEAVVGASLRFCGNKSVGLRGGSGYVSKDEAQANLNAAQMGDAGWFFVGRESFVGQCKMTRPVMKGRGANKEPVLDRKTGKPKIKTWYEDNWGGTVPLDGLIYDEVQMAASRTSASQEVLAKVDASFKLGQSADWWGTDLDNMYDVHEMLWPGKLGMNKAEWIDEYMETKFDPFTWNKKKTVGEIWEGFFATTLPCYVAIPSPIEKPKPDQRMVHLLPAQRKLYDKLAEDMAAEIDGDILVTELPLHLNMRLRELALGMFRVVELEPRIDAEGNLVPRQTIAFDAGAPSSTVDEIKRIQRDYPGEPMIVLTGSQKFAEKAAIDLGGLPYTGKQSEPEKAEAIRAFIAGEVKVLVGTSAMTEGLDGLQEVCRLAVIASRVSIPYQNEQFIGRVARRGQKRPVVALEICAIDTIQVGVTHKSIETILRNHKAKAIQK